MLAEEEKRKRLRLLVLTDFSLYGDAAVSHAAAMALVFQAELMIIPLVNMDSLPAQGKFSNALNVLEQQNLPVIYHTNSINLKKDLYAFMEEHEVMMLIIAVSPRGESFFSYRSALRLIKKMRTPVLAVGKTLPQNNAYQKILLPLDYSIYAKEKSLWASYFHRFYKSEIHILFRKYKDEYLQYKSYENLEYTKQLYHNLSIKHIVHISETSTNNFDLYTQSFAEEIGATLILSMTTKYLDAGDLFMGTKEKKTIRHVDDVPYLYINQRDDLYVLCT